MLPATLAGGRHDEPGELVERTVAAAERSMAKQFTDPASPDFGGFPQPDGLVTAETTGGTILTFVAAYLHPESKLRGSEVLAERIRMAAGHLNNLQHADGFIDLLITNFDSPPDTAFLVNIVAMAAHLLQQAGQRELFTVLEPFLRKAGAGLTIGGVHTPNHRWVVCSALAQLHELFGEAAYIRRIDQWLAEGIDIDADGQYTERSPSIYNAVCNRSLLTIALKLKRPELMEPVRKNLQTMLYLLHANQDVVTEMSTRQDRNLKADMGYHWFPVRYLAIHDRNGQLETLARHLDPRYASLGMLMEYPELLQPRPEPAPLPDNYVRHFPVTGIVRYRRGKSSATLLADNYLVFALHHGDAAITSVSFASAFFGRAQFIGSKLGGNDGGYQMEQSLAWGYFQPFTPPRHIPAGMWHEVVRERQRTQECHLKQSVDLVQTNQGFRLRIRASGTDRVPVSIRIGLPKGAKVEGCDSAPPDIEGSTLRDGYATVSVGNDKIRFGPGLYRHSFIHMRGLLTGNLTDTPVYLTGLTPLDHTIEFLVG